MFVALLGLIGLGVTANDKIKEDARNEKARRIAYKRGEKIYLDSQGVLRSVKSNRHVHKAYYDKGVTTYWDSGNRDYIDEINPYYVKEMERARREAERRGELTYTILNNNKKERLLVRNNLPVKGYGIFCCTPKFYLQIFPSDSLDKSGDLLVAYNRKNIYNWYKEEWYTNGNTNKSFIQQIKDIANKYEIIVFDKDLDYCQEMLYHDSYKNFQQDEIDPIYKEATWVDNKYWIRG